ncbi:MAG: hypothetical protein ACRD9S_20250 [Pyrinomonadaceae bacterium]
MNRNAKIALGCGGAGCLGLIVVVIAVVVLIVTGVIKAPGLYDANRNSNYNYNSNSNFNSNANTNDNVNANSNSDSGESSSMSDDDKHKLFQAAGMTQDSALILRVLKKIGFSDVSGEDYQQFTKDHAPWALRNMEFVRSVITPESAREYVEAHIDD